MRVYVPATAGDLRRLEAEGRLPAEPDLVAFAVTPWVMSELDVDHPEDETAEHAVLSAAADHEVEGAAPTAVLVFDLPGPDLPFDGLQVFPAHELPRRRLVAIHLCPDLEWYAGQELPDVVVALAAG